MYPKKVSSVKNSSCFQKKWKHDFGLISLVSVTFWTKTSLSKHILEGWKEKGEWHICITIVKNFAIIQPNINVCKNTVFPKYVNKNRRISDYKQAPKK